MFFSARYLQFFARMSCIYLLVSVYAYVVFKQPDIVVQETEDGYEIVIPRCVPNATQAKTTCPDGPKSNLYFLETHQTGTSTLRGILVRYALNKKLLVGVPQGSMVSYYRGAKFVKSQTQPLSPEGDRNMFAEPLVFDHQAVEASQLPSDSVFLTILQEPATNFETRFNSSEVKAFQRVEKKSGLEEYLANPTKYFRGPGDGMFWWFAKNGAFFELGYDNLNDTDTYIHDAMHNIEGAFDLVLISEYFDMSLILLKDLLCWDMVDMAYLSKYSQSTLSQVTEDVKKKIYEWNKVDTALYRHFNETFWTRVEKYGKDRMERDLEELKSIKNELETFCVEHHLTSNEESKDIALKEGRGIREYKLKEQGENNATCRWLMIPQGEWWKELFKAQEQNLKRRIIIAKP